LRLVGSAAIAGYAIHAGRYLVQGSPANALWICHLAALLVGIGLLGRWPTVNGIGLLCLAVGAPLWALDLLGGAEFIPTSLLTHLLGLVLGLYGAAALGLKRGTWRAAALFVAGMLAVSRLWLPPAQNVNLVIHPPAGWDAWYPFPRLYLVQLLLQWCFWLLVFEKLLRLYFDSARRTK